MNSFVCLYNFRNDNLQKQFEKKLEKQYPLSKKEEVGNMPYYGFGARNLAEVEENLGGLITTLRAGDADVVAVFYDRKADSNMIKRSLIFGQENRLESLLGDVRRADHDDTVTDLLNTRFDKMKASLQ